MNNDSAYYRLAFKIFADFTGIIAVPAVLAAVLGKWVDVKLGTGQKFLIVFVFMGFLSTAAMITKKARRYKSEYERIMNDERLKSASFKNERDV